MRTDQVAKRNRSSPFDMETVSNAYRLVKTHCEAIVETEVINIEDGLDRVLAEDVDAKTPYPPFRASIKDGYAVVCSDRCSNRAVIDYSGAGDSVSFLRIFYVGLLIARFPAVRYTGNPRNRS